MNFSFDDAVAVDEPVGISWTSPYLNETRYCWGQRNIVAEPWPSEATFREMCP